MKDLIDRGADVHSTGENGMTCLHCAAWHNQVNIARHLVAAGADVYATDDSGNYPVHTAALSIFNTTNMVKNSPTICPTMFGIYLVLNKKVIL